MDTSTSWRRPCIALWHMKLPFGNKTYEVKRTSSLRRFLWRRAEVSEPQEWVDTPATKRHRAEYLLVVLTKWYWRLADVKKRWICGTFDLKTSNNTPRQLYVYYMLWLAEFWLKFVIKNQQLVAMTVVKLFVYLRDSTSVCTMKFSCLSIVPVGVISTEKCKFSPTKSN